jgi:hypothetical protein
MHPMRGEGMSPAPMLTTTVNAMHMIRLKLDSSTGQTYAIHSPLNRCEVGFFGVNPRENLLKLCCRGPRHPSGKAHEGSQRAVRRDRNRS